MRIGGDETRLHRTAKRRKIQEIDPAHGPDPWWLDTGREYDVGQTYLEISHSKDSAGKYCGSAHWIAVDEVAKIEELKHDPHKDAKKVIWVWL